jgi:hypothetical protein
MTLLLPQRNDPGQIVLVEIFLIGLLLLFGVKATFQER